ncbi:MAG: TIGR03915 family putative DNA repair protein [Treponema sp.]|jgi:probable DNA metabolism protein|nr:TIGR03915 family putative DNA repair protein [Treponema sp.]
MIRNLDELFDFSEDCAYNASKEETDCFNETICSVRVYDQHETDLLCAYFSDRFNIFSFNENARNFYEISADVFDTLLHAWMSELPIDREITAFGRKILAVAQSAGGEEKRKTAHNTMNDRGNADSLAVLNAAEKVRHEAHRMMGLLRFSPNKDGEFIARCAADHFILPALGEYFTARFGQTAWAIIDEKRKLCLHRKIGEYAKITTDETAGDCNTTDEWEELWKHYHKTINNEERQNPQLQRQFMPKRYWKYLPEA